MRILGIETSCDETACAVVEDGTRILSNVVVSSQKIQEKYGGVIPEIAARRQVESIMPVIAEALEQGANWVPKRTNSPHIDGIAVTVGPGLVGSLLVGVETAKTLAMVWDKPVTPVNHLVGHIYANYIREFPKSPTFLGHHRASNFQFSNNNPKFPLLALVVSGGHTDLVLMKDHSQIEWIGGTRDDAAGEAFDKTARLLGLPYPGGPSISAAAEKYEVLNPKLEKKLFPRPMINEYNFDWSFSGLKTAVLNEVHGRKLMQAIVDEYAAEVQEAIVDGLVEKSIRAIKGCKVKSFLLAGGVAANSRLRKKFDLEILNSKLEIDFRVPPPYLCTDNAAYIAAAAYFHWRPVDWQSLESDPSVSITDVV